MRRREERDEKKEGEEIAEAKLENSNSLLHEAFFLSSSGESESHRLNLPTCRYSVDYDVVGSENATFSQRLLSVVD